MMLYDVFYKGNSFDSDTQLPGCPQPDTDYARNVNGDGHVLRPASNPQFDRAAFEALMESARKIERTKKYKAVWTSLAPDQPFGAALAAYNISSEEWKACKRATRENPSCALVMAWIAAGRPAFEPRQIWA